MTRRVCTVSLAATNHILNSSKLRGYKYYRLVGFSTEGMREHDEVRITPTSLIVVMTLHYLMFIHSGSGCDRYVKD